MANKKLFIAADLGPGDGGKGGVVHALSLQANAHTIVKVGGAQGSHGVRNSRGESFAFSQFGCGTLEGIPTFVSRNFVVGPYQLLNEADELRREHGIADAFDRLTIDGRSLCATPVHRCVSQLRELARKGKPKGTVGTGMGEAVADAEENPELAVYAADLGAPGLRDKLEALRRFKLRQIAEILEGDFLEADRPTAFARIAELRDEGITDWTLSRFTELSRLAKIVPDDYFAREVLGRDGRVVIESSHGVLTDRFYGFYPHTSRLRTLPSRTREMLAEEGYNGEVSTIGVFRAYGIRHGAGPFVAEDPSMLERLLPGSSKDENRFQGKVRVGALDLVALRYAIDVCGGPEAFGGLAVTWFDQILANGSWPVCESYQAADDPDFFTSDRQILVRRGEDDAQLERQRVLGERLRACRPNVSTVTLPEFPDSEAPARFCADRVSQALGVPVRMVSVGPTEDHKEFF